MGDIFEERTLYLSRKNKILSRCVILDQSENPGFSKIYYLDFGIFDEVRISDLVQPFDQISVSCRPLVTWITQPNKNYQYGDIIQILEIKKLNFEEIEKVDQELGMEPVSSFYFFTPRILIEFSGKK